jgi:hypothetical protein
MELISGRIDKDKEELAGETRKAAMRHAQAPENQYAGLIGHTVDLPLLHGSITITKQDEWSIGGVFNSEADFKVYSLDRQPLFSRGFAKDLSSSYLKIDQQEAEAMPGMITYDSLRSSLESVRAFFGANRKIGFDYEGGYSYDMGKVRKGWRYIMDVDGITAKGTVTVRP